MTKFFLIHGAYGNPEENWFPWLKQELEKQGNTVFAPKFPTPENQTLDNWMNEFEKYLHLIDEDSVFIGHSLAPLFIFSILEKISVKIRACFFVAGFLDLLGNKTFDEINKTFVEQEFDWQKIKNNCKNFYVYHSDNDPYVPVEQGKKLANKLGVQVVVVKNAGHFNKVAGFTKFERLLQDIGALG